MAIVLHAPERLAEEFYFRDTSLKLYDTDDSVFLAGSIIDAPDWQREATEILRTLGYNGYVFNPRRPTPRYYDTWTEEDSIEQTNWERDHLRKADVIAFWLPKDTPAKHTHFELGYFMHEPHRIVVGIEPGMRREFLRVYLGHASIPVYDTLQQTLEEVARRIKAKKPISVL